MFHKQWNCVVLIATLIFCWIGNGTAANSTATGTVFLDTNGNQVKDDTEKGLPEVRVSNGEDIVKTDANGQYSLAVSDDTILFVIKPRGFMTPVNENRLPRFYYVHKPHGSPEGLKYAGIAPTGPLPESVDFPLIEQAEGDTFKVLVFGDTQPYNMQEIEWLAHDVIEEVIGIDAVFGISLGDLVGDDLNLFHPLNEVMATVGIPWYNVHGNHDMNFLATDDRYADETFERVYGPACYSFDWGPVHFINIDNVHFYQDEENRPRYSSEVGERQLTFIRNDLALVPKDQLVVVSFHIPLTEMRDVKELMNLLGDRPHTLSYQRTRTSNGMTSSVPITVGMETMHITTTIMRPHRAVGGEARLMKSVSRTPPCVMVLQMDMAFSHSAGINTQFGLKPPVVQQIIR